MIDMLRQQRESAKTVVDPGILLISKWKRVRSVASCVRVGAMKGGVVSWLTGAAHEQPTHAKGEDITVWWRTKPGALKTLCRACPIARPSAAGA